MSLAVGERVRLKGLCARHELNGDEGCVVTIGDRVGVRLDRVEKPILLKPENVLQIAAHRKELNKRRMAEKFHAAQTHADAAIEVVSCGPIGMEDLTIVIGAVQVAEALEVAARAVHEPEQPIPAGGLYPAIFEHARTAIKTGSKRDKPAVDQLAATFTLEHLTKRGVVALSQTGLMPLWLKEEFARPWARKVIESKVDYPARSSCADESGAYAQRKRETPPFSFDLGQRFIDAREVCGCEEALLLGKRVRLHSLLQRCNVHLNAREGRATAYTVKHRYAVALDGERTLVMVRPENLELISQTTNNPVWTLPLNVSSAAFRVGGGIDAWDVLIRGQPDKEKRDQSLATLLRWLDAGGNIDARPSVDAHPHLKGCGLLQSAAEGGHEGCVRMLIDRGANVDMQDTAGCTALMTAAEPGYWWIVEDLLLAGANAKLQDENGETALDKAEAARDMFSTIWSRTCELDSGPETVAYDHRITVRLLRLHARTPISGSRRPVGVNAHVRENDCYRLIEETRHSFPETSIAKDDVQAVMERTIPGALTQTSTQRSRTIEGWVALARNEIKAQRKGNVNTAVVAANTARERGNDAIRAGNMDLALSSYDEAIDLLWPFEARKEAAETLVLCLSNRAEVCLRLKRAHESLDDCSDALMLLDQHRSSIDDGKAQSILDKLQLREKRAEDALGMRHSEEAESSEAAADVCSLEAESRKATMRAERAKEANEKLRQRNAKRKAIRQQKAERRRSSQTLDEQQASLAETKEIELVAAGEVEERDDTEALRLAVEELAAAEAAAAYAQEALEVRKAARARVAAARRDQRQRRAEQIARLQGEREQADAVRRTIDLSIAEAAGMPSYEQLANAESRKAEQERAAETRRELEETELAVRLSLQTLRDADQDELELIQEEECAICLEGSSTGPMLKLCGHHPLHAGCASLWRRKCRSGENNAGRSQEPSCPVCRMAI